MRDILNQLKSWVSEGNLFATATVIQTWGSAPREVGSVMAITGELHIAGSVSGGCVENAVIEEAELVLKTGIPKVLEFGVSDDTAWSVGLTCGGKIKVLVEKHPAFTNQIFDTEIWHAIVKAIENNLPVVMISRLDGQPEGHLLVYANGNSLGDWGELTNKARDVAIDTFQSGKSLEITIDGIPIFAQLFPRRDRVIVIGASHIAIPFVELARKLEFETIVIDPRKIFADRQRFPVPPDQLLDKWPEEALENIELNEDTYAVLVTHDPKIDDPALHILLKSPVAYIGALGSKKTHEKRKKRLLEAGFSLEEIDRIYAPVGLDILARTPEEIALSILAQIVSEKRKEKSDAARGSSKI